MPRKKLPAALEFPDPSAWTAEICLICEAAFSRPPAPLRTTLSLCCSPRCRGLQQIDNNRIRDIAPEASPWLQGLYRQAFFQARKGAKKRNRGKGFAFELTIEQFNQMVLRCQDRCEKTRRFFQDLPEVKKHDRQSLRPSIDRIDADDAYTFANCRLVTVSVNIGMGTWGDVIFDDNSFALVSRTHHLIPKTAAEMAADRLAEEVAPRPQGSARRKAHAPKPLRPSAGV